MKNNIPKIIVIIFIFLNINNSTSEEFELKSENINILDSGDVIEAKGDVEIKTDNDIIITSNESVLNKKKSLLKAMGNVRLIDRKNKTKIDSEIIIYNKKDNLISAKGQSTAYLKDIYILVGEDIYFDKNKQTIYSNNNSILKDENGNILKFSKFKYSVNDGSAIVSNLDLKDNKKNNFLLDDAVIDLNNRSMTGNNANVIFNKSIFGNEENDPRISGKKLFDNEQNTTIEDAEFTSCKLNPNEKCPPWLMKAEKVTHNKKKKIIEYKNAWLNIYDKPVFYFPFFYHPDPTVKRQSGFLMPKISNSSFLGSSMQLPYYNVISESKDLTFSPRLFFDDKYLFQTEYRQAGKNSDFIIDHGLNNSGDSFNSHLFANLTGDYKSANIELNLETVSNRKYLKKYDVNSALINDITTLNSFVSYETYSNDTFFYSSFETFEDLTKEDSDSFEYIYPNYVLSKNLETEKNGNLTLSSSGFQKKYDTNKYDGLIVNDLIFSSDYKVTQTGILRDFSLNLKNVNSNGDNSDNYNNEMENKILGTLLYNLSLPLVKNTDKGSNYFTPTVSARFSPTQTKNIEQKEIRVDYINLFNIDRLNEEDMIEGGESITFGGEYSFESEGNKVLGLSAGQVFRLNENNDLPINSSIGQKSSNIIGSLDYTPNEHFNINYDFSIDNGLNELKYNYIETGLSVNNFFTSFNFLETNNVIGDNNKYISNQTKISFDENNSLGFSTNKNLNINLTEYYDIIYEYQNDCLKAALEYKKTYYEDIGISPDENIFFTLTIVPFGNLSSPTLK